MKLIIASIVALVPLTYAASANVGPVYLPDLNFPAPTEDGESSTRTCTMLLLGPKTCG